jgi:hypothetical protein
VATNQIKGYYLDGTMRYDSSFLLKTRREERRKQRTKSKLVSQQAKRSRLVTNGPNTDIPEDLISISEASRLMPEVKYSTIWSWFVELGLITIYYDPTLKNQANQVSRAEVMSFRERYAEYLGNINTNIYGYTAFGRVISPDRPITRQTIGRWVKEGKLHSIDSPGNQTLIPGNQIPIGQELARSAEKFSNFKKP